MKDKPCDLCGKDYAVYVCWPVVGSARGKDICEGCKVDQDAKKRELAK